MRQRRKPRAAQLGVTDAEYDRLLAAQGGECAIRSCHNKPRTRRLHVDHDHKTRRVRGLLCNRCNRALPTWVTRDWLGNAADYIDPPNPLAQLIDALPVFPVRPLLDPYRGEAP